jgi:hypothetical protein
MSKRTVEASGDPHSRQREAPTDYHGRCDLVLLTVQRSGELGFGRPHRTPPTVICLGYAIRIGTDILESKSRVYYPQMVC